MDIATIIGLLLGIILIGGSMLFTSLNYGLSMGAFWNLESMMIVLGGTLSATAIAFRLNDVKNVFGLIKFVFQKPSYQLDLVVDDLVNLGEAYRKDRKSLEQAAQGLNNRFLKDGVLFINSNFIEFKSEATLVSYPSSCKIPDNNSLISSSSSIIRISFFIATFYFN